VTEPEIRAGVLAALRRIAPEVDPASLRSAEHLREQVDMDSVDFLRFLVAIRDSLGVDVPEADYPKVASLDGLVGYIAARSAPGAHGH
jgi:acyl carrier protein